MMNRADVLSCSNIVVNSENGTSSLKKLVMRLASEGRLTNQCSDDGNGSDLKNLLDEVKEPFNSSHRGKKKIADIPLSHQLPKNWAQCRIGDALELINGKAFKPTDWTQNGVPIIRIQNLNNSLAAFNFYDGEIDSKFRVSDGDLLISWSGTPGTSFGAFIWDRGAAVLNQHIFNAKQYHNIFDIGFLKLVINSRLDVMIEAAHGAVGLRHITKGKLEAIVIPIPPLPEQKRIVSKVDELMALIDELEQKQNHRAEVRQKFQSAALQALVKAEGPDQLVEAWRRVCSSWGVLTWESSDVEVVRSTILNLAVQGKLVDQFAIYTPVDSLMQSVDSERKRVAESDRRAKATPLEMIAVDYCWQIPETWRWRALADLALFVDYRGKTPKKTGSGIKLITAKNVRKRTINLQPEEFVSIETYESWMTRGLPSYGNVLFTTEAPMGNAAMVRLKDKFALAQRTICLQPYDQIDPEYLEIFLTSDLFHNTLESAATGMTAKGIKSAKLKLMPVAIPPLEEQKRIVAKVNELMSLCDQLETNLTLQQELGDRLAQAIVAAA